MSNKEKKKSQHTRTGRRRGRPRKSDPPLLPYEDVDRLLVHGETVLTDDGVNTTVRYPSYRDLAVRFGVSHSIIADYAAKHDCLRRRREARMRVKVKADQKVIEMRARALAVTKEHELSIIDAYLLRFEEALADGRVRFDSPSDFNAMVRLKEFIMGGPDSRQEIHAALSLEDIQARHKRMMREVQEAPIEVRGEVINARLIASTQDEEDLETAPESPRALSGGASGENELFIFGGHFSQENQEVNPVADQVVAPQAPHAPLSAPDAPGWDHGASGGDGAPHGPTVAPWAAEDGASEAWEESGEAAWADSQADEDESALSGLESAGEAADEARRVLPRRPDAHESPGDEQGRGYGHHGRGYGHHGRGCGQQNSEIPAEVRGDGAVSDDTEDT